MAFDRTHLIHKQTDREPLIERLLILEFPLIEHPEMGLSLTQTKHGLIQDNNKVLVMIIGSKGDCGRCSAGGITGVWGTIFGWRDCCCRGILGGICYSLIAGAVGGSDIITSGDRRQESIGAPA